MNEDAGRRTQDAGRSLRVALSPFVAGADPAANARVIAQAIDAAAEAGAQVLLTPECALCGYPSAARQGLADLDRCALADREDRLLIHAERRGLMLVMGSAESGPTGWTNDAVIGGAVAAQRYRKRSLTPIDRGHFVAGPRSCVVACAGWKLGIAICYDLRFAPIIADLARADADAFLVIAHMAGVDPDPGVKATVIPQLCAIRATEWATPLAFCNTAADDRWCDSGAWDARGMPLEATTGGDLFLVDLSPRTRHGSWYATLREDHLRAWSATT
jgi:5-aminopentanamidase